MFIWDAANISHLARHDVAPKEAEEAIANDPFDLERQVRNGEERIAHLGETISGRILVVVVTLVEEDIRVVTAFPANRKLRRFYATQKDQSHAKDTQHS